MFFYSQRMQLDVETAGTSVDAILRYANGNMALCKLLMRWIQRRRDIDQTVLRQLMKLSQETDHSLNEIYMDSSKHRNHVSALIRVVHNDDAAVRHRMQQLDTLSAIHDSLLAAVDAFEEDFKHVRLDLQRKPATFQRLLVAEKEARGDLEAKFLRCQEEFLVCSKKAIETGQSIEDVFDTKFSIRRDLQKAKKASLRAAEEFNRFYYDYKQRELPHLLQGLSEMNNLLVQALQSACMKLAQYQTGLAKYDLNSAENATNLLMKDFKAGEDFALFLEECLLKNGPFPKPIRSQEAHMRDEVTEQLTRLNMPVDYLFSVAPNITTSKPSTYLSGLMKMISPSPRSPATKNDEWVPVTKEKLSPLRDDQHPTVTPTSDYLHRLSMELKQGAVHPNMYRPDLHPVGETDELETRETKPASTMKPDPAPSISPLSSLFSSFDVPSLHSIMRRSSIGSDHSDSVDSCTAIVSSPKPVSDQPTPKRSHVDMSVSSNERPSITEVFRNLQQPQENTRPRSPRMNLNHMRQRSPLVTYNSAPSTRSQSPLNNPKTPPSLPSRPFSPFILSNPYFDSVPMPPPALSESPPVRLIQPTHSMPHTTNMKQSDAKPMLLSNKTNDLKTAPPTSNSLIQHPRPLPQLSRSQKHKLELPPARLTSRSISLSHNRLSRFSEFDRSLVPKLVLDCVDYLLVKGIDEEGLFRIPGDMNVIKELMRQYERGTPVDLMETVFDPCTVAGLLKFYVKIVGQMLITDEVIQMLFQANQSVEKMRQVIQSNAMTVEQRSTLIMILFLFNQVAEHEQTNKMSRRNIARVFGLTMFRDQMGVDISNSTLELWMRHLDTLFA